MTMPRNAPRQVPQKTTVGPSDHQASQSASQVSSASPLPPPPPSSPHNASVHNSAHGGTEPATPVHHGPMREDESRLIGTLVHRAAGGDAQATHDLLAHVHPL